MRSPAMARFTNPCPSMAELMLPKLSDKLNEAVWPSESEPGE